MDNRQNPSRSLPRRESDLEEGLGFEIQIFVKPSRIPYDIKYFLIVEDTFYPDVIDYQI